MGNEEKRLTYRQTRFVDNTLCQRLHWQIRTCQRIRKNSALRLSMAKSSDTAHYLNETIIVIGLSSENKMTRSTLLTTQLIQKVLDTLLAFLHSHRDFGHNTNIGARLTNEAVSSIANSPSAELDTSTSEQGGHSSITTRTSPHRFGARHGYWAITWWIYIFIQKFLII